MNIQNGRLEVICGGMFSGKTEELLRRARRAQFANQKVQFLNPLWIHAMTKSMLNLITQIVCRLFLSGAPRKY